MTSSGPVRAARRAAATQRFLITFGAIIALIVVLLFLDFFLARVDRNETRQHAANLFRDGTTLLAKGKSSEALDQLATAVSLDRHNPAYGLALAQATMATGREADAEAMLNDLLGRAPNDGAISLTMARLLVAANRPDDARAFYHRAIYGRWGKDSTAKRMKARLELIGLLTRQDAREELLAELLPLQAMSGDSTMLLRTVAPLYVRAGSPGRAAVIYRELLRREPNDSPAYVGLSDADIALGQLRTARADLLKATEQFPADTAIAARLSRLDSAFALDPGGRGLSDAERLRRSRVLLENTLASADQCQLQTATPQEATLLDSARASLETQSRLGAANESELDRRLSLLDSLWVVIGRSCSTKAGTSVLDLVQLLMK